MNKQDMLLFSPKFAKQREYWIEKLSGDIDETELLTGGRKDSSSKGSSAETEIHFSGASSGKDLSQRLIKLGKNLDISIYIILLSALKIVIHRYTGKEDITVITPVYQKNITADTINNSLFVRDVITKDMTFKQIVLNTRKILLEAYVNQDYPSDKLIEYLFGQQDDITINPISNVVCSYDAIHQQKNIQQLTNDVAFKFERKEEQITGKVSYDAARYDESYIKQASIHFIRILEAGLQNLESPVSELSILTEKEKKELLEQLDHTEVNYPEEETLHQLFEQQAGKNPGRVAVKDPKKGNTISYGGLNYVSSALSKRLRENGIQTETVVALITEPSIEMVMGILGILKAGGVYLPIDSEYPEIRKKYMLQDSGVSFLLARETYATQIDTHLQVELLKDLEKVNTGDIIEASNQEVKSNNSAYIIYTSGTTGQPKGTVLEHRNVVRLLFNDQPLFDFNQKDIWTMFHSYCFDFSVWEMYGALLLGGKLVVIPREMAGDPRSYLSLLKQEAVTVLNQTPAVFYVLSEEEINEPSRELNLRYVIFGGEALAPVKLRGFRIKYPKTRLINMFGITETTVHVTFKEIGDQEIEDNVSNIGQPIPTLSCLVLDEDRELQPKGVAGELCVGGEGVGRGYLNRPELSHQKFIDNPFQENGRVYCSGDLARLLYNGDMEYLGRIDLQVKIRGFRIELGEIENQILKIPKVKQVVVLALEVLENEKQLVAYVVREPQDNEAGEKGGVDLNRYFRECLEEELPAYMIPSHFLELEEIPLTSNGKVDRKKLPKPEITAGEGYVAPRNETERKLVSIFARVLKQEEEVVGIDSNFFELGGHSLKVINLIAKIHKELQVKIKLTEIFKIQTIRGLAQYVSESEGGIDRFETIKSAQKKEYYPLSSQQKRVYFIQQMDPGNTSYNNLVVKFLDGGVSKERIEVIIKKIAIRHESLRTTFHLQEGEPVQKILPEVEVRVTCHETNGDQDKMRQVIAEFVKPFQLDQSPLFRVATIKINGDRHLLLIDVHHIITDGTSLNILIEDFIRLYQGEELEPLKLQYKDFSEWQHSEEQKKAVEKQEQYWVNHFESHLPLELPLDYDRPAGMSFEGGYLSFEIPKQETEALYALSKSQGVTLYMVILSAFSMLLSKLSGQENVVVGTPVQGRRHADLENVIGILVNTIGIRTQPEGNKTYIQYLEEVKKSTLGAFENQDYPFEDLVEKVLVERDISRNPLFDVMLILQNQEQGSTGNVYGDITHMPSSEGNQQIDTKFEMTLTGIEGQDKLLFIYEYRRRLFKKETIIRYVQYFKKLLTTFTQELHKKISELEMISEEEKEQLLEGFNQTRTDYPKGKTLHQIFEEQETKIPQKTAVVCNKRVLTYRHLNETSNQLARILKEKGAGINHIVVLMSSRTQELVIGVMGILKANAVCLPLDKKHPKDWVSGMLADCGAKFLLKQQNQTFEFPFDGDEISIDTPERSSCYGTNPGGFQTTDTLAFMIYTSGSTGRPKGTLLCHHGVCNHVYIKIKEVNILSNEVMCHNLSISFVASLWQYFAPLFLGGRLVVYSEELIMSPYELFERVEQDKVTVIEVVPSVLNTYLELLALGKPRIPFTQLRSLVLTGERVLPSLVRKFYQQYQLTLLNAYGQAECSDDTLHYSFPFDLETKKVYIGYPANNTRIYVCDNYMKLQPMGVVGELFISGEGIAPGYLNRSELTGEKFVEVESLEGEYCFRTGDICKRHSDGKVEFLGRRDEQIKIRGFRIELGEIANRLLEIKHMKESAVIDKTSQGEKYLCAYYVSEKDIKESDIRNRLIQQLPGYMVPSYYVRIDRIPKNVNGKVERRELPEPEFSNGDQYIAPMTDVERRMVGIWSDVLGMEKESIGINSDFFRMGGHSLKATLLVSRIHKAFHVKVPLMEIFRISTVKELSLYVNQAAKVSYESVEPVEKKEYYPLSSAQKRLFVIHRMEPESLNYNINGMTPLNASVGKEELEKVFQELIQRYESLRTSFHLVKEEAIQVIQDNPDFHILLFKCNTPTEIPGIMEQFIKPFDLKQGPLLRVGLLQLQKQRQMILFDIHHIISDGFSSQILRQDVEKMLAREMLPELRLQYKDFAEWQMREEHRQSIDPQETFWMNTLEGELPVLDIPTDYPRPEIQSFEGATYCFKVGSEETQKLRQWAKEQDITMFMLLLGAFYVMLSKLSGQEDILVGTPVACRRHVDFQNIMGLFVNTLVLRNRPEKNKTIIEFLQQVKRNTIEAFDNQEYQFEDLVGRRLKTRDASRSPLFDILFNLLDQRDQQEPEVDENEDMDLSFTKTASKVDILITGIEIGQVLVFEVEYSTRLFRRETIKRYMDYYQRVMSAIPEKGDQKILDVEIINIGEGEELFRIIREEKGQESIQEMVSDRQHSGNSKADFIF